MRAVQQSIPVFFLRSMRDAEFLSVHGGRKLKVCDAMGVRRGDGLAWKVAKKAVRAQLAAERAACKAAKKNRAGAPGSLKTFFATMGRESALAAAGPAPEVLVVLSDSEPELDVGSVDAAAPVSPPPKPRPQHPGSKWARRAKTLTSHGLTKDEQYEDNKLRAVLATTAILAAWTGAASEAIRAIVLDPNAADALLQGLWVIWTKVSPRVPTRTRKRKAAAVV